MRLSIGNKDRNFYFHDNDWCILRRGYFFSPLKHVFHYKRLTLCIRMNGINQLDYSLLYLTADSIRFDSIRLSIFPLLVRLPHLFYECVCICDREFEFELYLFHKGGLASSSNAYNTGQNLLFLTCRFFKYIVHNTV